MPAYQPKLNLVVEGETDRVVLTRLLHSRDFTEIEPFVMGGKGKLLERLHSYNQAARFANWLVVLDLDREECAPGYLRRIMPTPSLGMMLRIPVREVETWLLADQEMMASFLRISVANLPSDPESLDDPKGFLINLVKNKVPLRYRRLRADLLPDPIGGQRVGPFYTNRVSTFVESHWRPEIAAGRSDSLARCIRALEDLKRRSAR